MASQEKRWKISRIAKSAGQNIETLDLETQKKILIRLECLQLNPFSGEVKKVQGKKNIYQERTQNYRLFFKLIPPSKHIEILLFEYRGKIKKKTIQRLK